MEIDLADFHPDGLRALQFGEFFADVGAHFDDIAARHDGNAEADGGLTVVLQEPAWRVGLGALQGGNVAQAELASGRVRPDEHLEHVLGGREGAGRVDGDVTVADADAPAVGRNVLFAQLGVDFFLVETELGEAAAGDLEKDHLLLSGEENDALDHGHAEQFAAQEVRVAAQFGRRVALAGQREENPEDVAEVVDDDRLAAGGRRQLALHVRDFAPQFVPDLRDAMFVIAVFDPHRDEGLTAGRFRIDVIDLTQLLAGDLDRVGDFLGDFGRAGAGVGRDDEGLLDGELGVFEPAEVAVGDEAAEDGQNHGHEDHAVVLDRKDAGVHIMAGRPRERHPVRAPACLHAGGWRRPRRCGRRVAVLRGFRCGRRSDHRCGRGGG